jgi:hypothetical protein
MLCLEVLYSLSVSILKVATAVDPLIVIVIREVETLFGALLVPK